MNILKITAIYGAMPGFDHGLARINNVIYETFKELGETVGEHVLSAAGLHFYDGIPTAAAENIIQEIIASDGIILSFATNLFAPCAVMQVFFEHLSNEKFLNCLDNKNIFLITSSAGYGESLSLSYVSKIVSTLGGYPAVSLGLNHQLVSGMDEELQASIEKYAEDYYRIIRQNRKFIIPRDIIGAPVTANSAAPAPAQKLSQEEMSVLLGEEPEPKITASELAKTVDMDSFTQKQEEDIDEITQYFATKYKEDVQQSKGVPVIREPLIQAAPSPAPRLKTCRQMTQNLPHYYQPQLAGGINATVQFSITGDDTFDGYLTIANTECDYSDGLAQAPDITIMCDSSVLLDVLKGKFSAQKAFMTGNLKVRGNFVLLTKFDQLFKLD